jgi:carnosine N-methyltransferase
MAPKNLAYLNVTLKLNRTDQINQHTIYPFIHSFSNMPSLDSVLKPVTIPDVIPSDLPENSDFSLVAGDFEEIYGISDEDALNDDRKEPQEGRWHAVMTCFFIDTVGWRFILSLVMG